MTDRDEPKKFRSTQMTFEELGAALEEIVQELSTLLEDEDDEGPCSDNETDSPDCGECDCDEEGGCDV